MLRIDSEKDIERGDVDDANYPTAEKKSEFGSPQTSPTLTQGSCVEEMNRDRGMH